MKRLDKKVIEPKVFRRDFLSRVSCGKLKSVFCTFDSDASCYNKLILRRVEELTLPLIDVYEIHANSYDGLGIGYCFDCYGKNVKYSYNFLVSSNREFSEYRVSQLNNSAFSLKYKLNRVLLYSYEGMASMVTLGLSDKAKDALDL